jgi:hypothetical protein
MARKLNRPQRFQQQVAILSARLPQAVWRGLREKKTGRSDGVAGRVSQDTGKLDLGGCQLSTEEVPAGAVAALAATASVATRALGGGMGPVCFTVR